MSLHYDDKGKIFTEYVSKVIVNAIIQTPTQRIIGQIYVRPDDRVSDELNKSDHFLAVTDATVYDLEGEVLYRCDFIAVNREHIIWLIPEEPNRQDVNQDREVE